MKTMEGLKIPKMMGLTEAAQKTGVSYHYLYQLCKTGKVVHIRSGRKYFINMDKLAEFFNAAGINEGERTK